VHHPPYEAPLHREALGRGGRCIDGCYLRQSCRDGHRTIAVATAVATATVVATVATATTVVALSSLRSIARLWPFPLPSPPSHRSTTNMGPVFTPRRYAPASPSPRSTPDSTTDEEAAGDGNASADDIVAAVLAARSVSDSTALRLRIGGTIRPRAYVGSVPGRRANRDRGFEGGMRRIMTDYSGLDGSELVYDEATLERRFRVPRVVLERIYCCLSNFGRCCRCQEG